ncbi:MAG: thioredoxin family protein [Azoarcus sp.]|jgi:thiol:disulfide interchange protein DsbD|nr:thioredoxin family protein [Azoarcus sp.]
MRAVFLTLLLLASAGLSPLALAQPVEAARAQTPHVQAQLLADVSAVRPGGEIWLGVAQKIIPGWHIYWKNPGDSGLPPTITWSSVPTGTHVGPLQWPTPGRFSMGPVTNYGYGGEVVLLAAARLPNDLSPGERITLGADVEWLVCEEECIPERVKLSLSLPVQTASAPGEDAAAITAARAKLPSEAPWPARFQREGGQVRLHLESAAFQQTPPRAVWFYPEAWGHIDHSGAQFFRVDERGLTITLPASEAASPDALGGVLVIERDGDAPRGFSIVATQTPVAATVSSAADVLLAMLMALAGGLLLNLMPCVFPVLSIKALSLLQHGGGRAARLNGLVYLAGVLASFVFLAGLLWLFRVGGENLGWGFQFQSPLFVGVMAALMFAVGLNLSGVFEIGLGATGMGDTLARRAGLTGSFFTGVLAVAVATPCTAPFMGAAIGYALAQPAPILLAVFLALGLGFALPYLALSFWPSLHRRLPRPGAWMVVLRQALAFPMYGATVWLVWVLARQGGPESVLRVSSVLLLLALAAWIYGKSAQAARAPRRLGAGAALFAILAGGFILASPGEAVDAATRHWEPYRPERLETLLQADKPVFVNLTADWCITCLANERVALDRAEVKDLLRRKGITYLKGDWTNQDADISALLAQNGRNGVPLYLFYPRGNSAPMRVLPQILTATLLVEAFSAVPDAVSPSHP